VYLESRCNISIASSKAAAQRELAIDVESNHHNTMHAAIMAKNGIAQVCGTKRSADLGKWNISVTKNDCEHVKM
jgi:hypothetical protein